MNVRPAVVQSFLDAVAAGYRERSTDARTSACLERVLNALEEVRPMKTTQQGRVGTADLLDQALEPAHRAGGNLANLARCIMTLDPMLTWRRRVGAAPQASASFPDGHANAMIVGPNGLEDRHDVWVGLSLLAPSVRYPDHNHSPEEIYLVLTDGQFRQGDGGWFTPGVGTTFYNEPNIRHAMASSASTPLLAVWCLFDGR